VIMFFFWFWQFLARRKVLPKKTPAGDRDE
jgi:hypothetical protein